MSILTSDRQKFSFRTVIASIERELTPDLLQRVAFAYEKKRYLEKREDIHGLLLFDDIITEGGLKHDDGGLIAQLIELLQSFKRADLVEKLTKYCLRWHVEVITTTGMPETQPGMDPDVSSTDALQKKAMGSVMLLEGKLPPSSGGAGSDPGLSELVRFNRKRKKLDIGALDEKQTRFEGDYHDSLELGEEPVGPHNDFDEQHMRCALEEAENSPDPDVKVGTVIVNKCKGKRLGKGHNRMPRGCEDLPWDDEEENLLETKYPYVLHSFKAALKDTFDNDGYQDLEGATIYTTLFPANTDAQWIADLGISEIVYLDNPYRRKTFSIAAKRILNTCSRGIKYRRMAHV